MTYEGSFGIRRHVLQHSPRGENWGQREIGWPTSESQKQKSSAASGHSLKCNFYQSHWKA